MSLRLSSCFHWRAFGMVGAVGWLMCFCAMHANSQQVLLRVRSTAYRAEVPIDGRPVTDDELIVVERHHGTEVLDSDTKMSATSIVRFLVDRTDVALVFDAQGVTSALNQDRSWITIIVRGAIRRILMSRTTKFAPDQRLEFPDEGGDELKIGKVFVRADQPLGLEKGRRYLLFFRQYSDGKLSPSGAPYLIEGGTLKWWRSGPSVAPYDLLVGRSLEQVAAEIQKVPNSGSPR